MLAGAGGRLSWMHRVAQVAFPTWAGACGIKGLAGLAVHTLRKPAAAGHLVYLCGGSRSFAYHASPRCEGLGRQGPDAVFRCVRLGQHPHLFGNPRALRQNAVRRYDQATPRRITRAGWPASRAFSSVNARVTTAPLPTTQPLGITAPFNTVTFEPIHT